MLDASAEQNFVLSRFFLENLGSQSYLVKIKISFLNGKYKYLII